MKKILLLILVFIVLISSVFASAYEDWILENYPTFEEENIVLQLRDVFQYGGLYIYPNTIIVNIGDVEIGSDLLKSRVEHELMHYYLSTKFDLNGQWDYQHEIIFSIEEGKCYNWILR